MEALHSMRFLARWLTRDENLDMETWAKMYQILNLAPHSFPCGCPNQRRWR